MATNKLITQLMHCTFYGCVYATDFTTTAGALLAALLYDAEQRALQAKLGIPGKWIVETLFLLVQAPTRICSEYSVGWLSLVQRLHH